MMTRRALLLAALLCCPPSISAQTYAPMVTMRVTTPDGTSHDISARGKFGIHQKRGRGAPAAVESKSNLDFKVAIVNIAAPPTTKSS
jgi:hypothetical protein